MRNDDSAGFLKPLQGIQSYFSKMDTTGPASAVHLREVSAAYRECRYSKIVCQIRQDDCIKRNQSVMFPKNHTEGNQCTINYSIVTL